MINIEKYIEVDDGGRWNFFDNAYNGDTWLPFHRINNNLYTYISHNYGLTSGLVEKPAEAGGAPLGGQLKF